MPARPKVRRHSYSVAELRAMALARAAEVEFGARDQEDHEEEALDADWPLEMLPAGARLVGFAQLAQRLAMDPRGYCLVEGVEAGAAGLDRFRRSAWGEAAGAFSFCAQGRTYTAFEDPSDSCRSAMGWLVEQEGNLCRERFEPVALVPEFVFSEPWSRWGEESGEPKAVGPGHPKAGQAQMLALLDPASMEPAVMVGTNCSDEFYPWFVAVANAERLESARAAGVALAYGLEAEVGAGDGPAKARRRL